MAGDIQRRIQLLIDGDKGGDRTAHVVEIALKAGHVLHDLVLRAGLERHGKEFHHAHWVGQTLEGGTIAFPIPSAGEAVSPAESGMPSACSSGSGMLMRPRWPATR